MGWVQQVDQVGHADSQVTGGPRNDGNCPGLPGQQPQPQPPALIFPGVSRRSQDLLAAAAGNQFPDCPGNGRTGGQDLQTTPVAAAAAGPPGKTVMWRISPAPPADPR